MSAASRQYELGRGKFPTGDIYLKRVAAELVTAWNMSAFRSQTLYSPTTGTSYGTGTGTISLKSFRDQFYKNPAALSKTFNAGTNSDILASLLSSLSDNRPIPVSFSINIVAGGGGGGGGGGGYRDSFYKNTRAGGAGGSGASGGYISIATQIYYPGSLTTLNGVTVVVGYGGGGGGGSAVHGTAGNPGGSTNITYINSGGNSETKQAVGGGGGSGGNQQGGGGAAGVAGSQTGGTAGRNGNAGGGGGGTLNDLKYCDGLSGGGSQTGATSVYDNLTTGFGAGGNSGKGGDASGNTTFNCGGSTGGDDGAAGKNGTAIIVWTFI